MNVHLVWVGDDLDESAVERVRAVAPNVMVWRDDLLVPDLWRPAWDRLALNPQLKKELIVYAVLRQHGGLYVDMDHTFLVPPEQVTEGWDTLTAVTAGIGYLIPGSMLYCPADWPHWGLVDEYLVEVGRRTTPESYKVFTDRLIYSLPKGTFHVVRDPGRFPYSAKSLTDRAEVVRFAVRPRGPGTQLKLLLRRIGLTASRRCPCNQHARIMDQRGCDWCEQHIDEIDGWLAEEARKRGLPYLSLAGKTLIRLAVRRARKQGIS